MPLTEKESQLSLEVAQLKREKEAMAKALKRMRSQFDVNANRGASAVPKRPKRQPPPADPCLCPLTGKFFVDPVQAGDGAIYEREALCQFWGADKVTPNSLSHQFIFLFSFLN